MIIDLPPYKGWQICIFRLHGVKTSTISYEAYSTTPPVEQLSADSKEELHKLIDQMEAK